MDCSSSSYTPGTSSASGSIKDVEFDDSNKMAKKISTLYMDPLLSDVCLLVGGQEYYAHKVILCTSSQVFQAMLTNPLWNECHEVKVELQESDVCSQMFTQFMQYLYTGKIRINHSNILPILTLADKYIIEDLIVLCTEYMSLNIPSAALHDQLISWFQYCNHAGHPQVAQACYKFSKLNFKLVSESPDFLTIAYEHLDKLLQENAIVVPDEVCILNALMRWLSNYTLEIDELPEAKREEMMVQALRLISHIRYPMMSTSDLVKLLIHPIAMKLKDNFIKWIALGISYHKDVKENVQEARNWGNGSLQFTPRLYNGERWSSTVSVDNYPLMSSYFVHTLMFSSQISFSEYLAEETCDWVIDIYSKGVFTCKCLMIVWEGTLEVPETIVEAVRLRITCRNPPPAGIKVKIGLLVSGEYEGVEHVMGLMQCIRGFEEGENIVTLDNIIPFDQLNSTLVGPDKDVLKISFVVAPLCENAAFDYDIVPLDRWIC